LVDAGFSCLETFRRLRAIRLEPEALQAIVITHEHTDHVAGLGRLARKLNIPVYMTALTHNAWRRVMRDKAEPELRLPKLETFTSGHAFQIGDIEVSPFTIPHDAADPVGFTFRSEGVKVGIVTDLGYMPASVIDHLRGCTALMIESNHDLEMLRGGPYPWAVKQRVMSRVGHLSNETLAEFFATHYDNAAAYLVLAHLSEQNNHPELARKAAEAALGTRCGGAGNQVRLASQHAPLPGFTL
jgi:phosphoribosyl 1,2-cyclic phosphodiesterase